MSPDLILTNARIVTGDAVVHGTVTVTNGRIATVDSGRSALPRALDLEGDILVPGLIDLHTDNLETHLEPRPGVHWPGLPALLTHDRQMVAAGITTSFDALSVGDADFGTRRRSDALERASALLAPSEAAGLLRAQHLLHLRCEVTADDVVPVFEALVDDPRVRLVSLMDHTPGQRQWANLQKWRQYNRRLKLSDAEQDAIFAARRRVQAKRAPDSRRRIVAMVTARGLPLATHDDTTEEHVAEAADDGATISEFPTTAVAARLARTTGMAIVMGAPNLVMGGSQSGNVAAAALAEEGLLDVLASDYVPGSLIEGCFVLHRQVGWPLPQAIATATAKPAALVGLADRGRIAEGLRADLVRVRLHADRPVVSQVWREGVAVG